MFADRATAEETIRKLYAYQHGHFSYRFSTLAIQDNQVVGLQLGYDHDQLAQEEFIGSLLLFFNSPTKRWWPLVKKIGPILADYVPQPTSNSYYINNIAVSSSCRGGGIGKLLLANTLKHAELSGYQCVELDVTSVNEAAIRFYEKNGFATVSTSGNEILHNNYGLPPLIRMQHRFQGETLSETTEEETNPLVINDVTALNPTKVSATFAPGSIEQLQILLTNTSLPISIGGGRFSMGGQIAAKDSLHIDMRGLNHILQFNSQEKVIRVQGGIRWCDIQSVIDAHGLAIKIMQTYSDFTVGGAVSVNCHGRYIGLGPLVLSIRSLQVMLHDGELIETSSTIRPEIFYGVVGGYGALGIITEVELDLTENTRVERSRTKLDIKDYLPFFCDHIRNNPNAVFHNADLYPPHYQTASAVTWFNTDSPVTTKDRLNPKRQLYLAEKYFMWAITETPFGKWRREHIIDPLIYARKKVHWRNYEAGYNVQELEPLFRDKRTYVLQEYFIPVDHFLEFTQQLTEILQRHHVNTVNISVRHAHLDSGCYLAWARKEMFAFVLYYKQRTRFNAKQRVAVWTRELVNAALNLNGSYYLPYQPHATVSQFHIAYKNAEKLFAMKRQLDPNYRFRNSLWDKYYKPSEHMEQAIKTSKSNT